MRRIWLLISVRRYQFYLREMFLIKECIRVMVKAGVKMCNRAVKVRGAEVMVER